MELISWEKFSLPEKIGNIGSEISRARFWHEKKKLDAEKISLERSLEMLQATLDSSLSNAARREIARMLELVADWYQGSHIYNVNPIEIENYFTEYAFLAKNI